MRQDPTAAKPARRIHKRGWQRRAHFVGGTSELALIQAESGLEAGCARAADLHPKVARWRPQPFTVDLITGLIAPTKDELIARIKASGQTPEPYTPDFEFQLTDGSTRLVEVRATRWIGRNPQALAAVASAMARCGMAHVLLTELELTDAIVENARLLAPYRSRQPDPASLSSILIEAADGCRFGALVSDITRREQVLIAIAGGYLACDLHRDRLTQETLLAPSRGDTAYLELISV